LIGEKDQSWVFGYYGCPQTEAVMN